MTGPGGASHALSPRSATYAALLGVVRKPEGFMISGTTDCCFPKVKRLRASIHGLSFCGIKPGFGVFDDFGPQAFG